LEALPEFIAATITRAMKKSDANLEQGRTTEFLNHYEYLLSELKSILGTEDMMLVILNTDFDRLSNKVKHNITQQSKIYMGFQSHKLYYMI
jgi:hypothetical protein